MIYVKNKTLAFSFLILFSFLSFLIWRIEVEFHGWDGLTWLSYFHWAIPICLLLFVVWVNIFFNFESSKRRIVVNSFLVFWVIVGFIVFSFSLESIFITGPSAMFYLMLPKWQLYLGRFITFIIFPLFPLISLYSLRIINIKISAKYIFLSQIIFWLAFPLSILLLILIPDKGYPNSIHAVKTGFVFPFLFFSLGFPLIYGYFQNKRTNNLDQPLILDDLI